MSMRNVYTQVDFAFPVPTPAMENPTPPSPTSPRIFLDLEGVLMNFTSLAALSLDNLQFPLHESGLVQTPHPVYTYTTKEILYDICNGVNFYSQLEKYAWADLLYQELYMATGGNVFFIVRNNRFDRGTWSGKADWIWRWFGESGYNRTIMVSEGLDSETNAFVNNWRETDILIDDTLDPAIMNWCKRGGIGYHWKEIDPRASARVVSGLVSERIVEIKQLVADLK